MDSVARYLSGTMIIALFWLFVGSNASSRSAEDAYLASHAMLVADSSNDQSQVYVPVPSVMYCTDIKNNEKNLFDEGFRILTTGISITNRNLGEELIELWLEPKNRDDKPGRFVVLRILPKLDLSCILTSGPAMMPGGSYAPKEPAN